MTAALTPAPKAQFLASDGTPLVGGKLYSYAAGTTTPLATYTTYAGTIANTNPVILDSRGEANVWLSPAAPYKLALYDADDALIWTVDNIYATNSGVFNGPVSGTTATFSGALTAASGAFSGAVSGTTGTFSGAVSGTTGTFSGNVQMASANGGQLAGLRNKIINGNMGIFQRGATAVTTNVYGPADRWKNDSVGSTFSTTQGSFVSGDTLFDTGGAQYFTTVAVTSVAGAANYVKIGQPIEDVRILAGQTVTVSFWAKAASGTPSIGFEVWQSFGTGGSPSATVTGVGQSQALTTTWTKYTKTFTVSSISGKTIGTTANTSFTVLDIWLDSGSSSATRSGSIGQASKTVSIAQVQLEVGPISSPFEQIPYGLSLQLCQRYYYRISPAAASAVFSTGGYAATTTASALMTPFPVTMRAAPSVLDQTGTATDYSVLTAGGSTITCSAVPTISASNVNNVRTVGTVASGLTAGQGAELRSATSNAYLGWSAEL
jgi:hypothetical protein